MRTRFSLLAVRGMGDVEQEASDHGSTSYGIPPWGLASSTVRLLLLHSHCPEKQLIIRRLGAEAHDMVVGNAEICVLPAEVDVLRC